MLTRNAMLVFLSSIALAQATVIEFELSPTGKDAAVGLAPANEAPDAVGSTGSGNAISGGISFDTTTSTLSFAAGYGSAAGYTNLTGPATMLHIHGPAMAGANASALFDLAPIHFPATTPANGGIIYGSVVFTPVQATNLLAGLNYVNIHTASNTDGEIRGQLTRVNMAPEVTCPGVLVIECGPPATFSSMVSDADGDAVQVVWSLNGVPVQTDNVAAGESAASTFVGYKASLALGINILGLTATDSYGNITTRSSSVTVVDTTPPVIVSVSVKPKVLWTPNHKLVTARIHALVTDACGSTNWEIVSVSSNQGGKTGGSGKRSPDWKITGDHTVLLRAERSGKDKDGRIYTISVRATDKSGNQSAITTVEVTVPHDKGK